MVSNRRTFIRRTAAALGTAALLSAGLAPASIAQPALPAPNYGSIPQAPSSADLPADEIAAAIERITSQPNVPEDLRSALERVSGFLTGSGEPGWEQPSDSPSTSDFPLPTVAEKCINGEGRSFGLATSVPGPAPLPLPGVPAHQVGYIFTGLGTKGVYNGQSNMKVHWVNIANGKFGTTPLTYNGINEGSHGTVNGVADTGSGIVIAALQGGFTADEESGPTECNYTPTATYTVVE
ncbi:hypothetical protein ACFORJ_00745 [Corynebacterium hansenii]|uniref:Secreted protein n=1 Tax=Corynebacterium hansenii TaxID=394964 RepID=A0ABV7ZLL9_9CORY|nr:hypothetical protein [Corynebacterium hansenii]WJY99471.1 hypothetical protein CHAN_04240 [Corynebacterium hansenii]